MPSPLGRIVFDEKPQFGATSATVYIAAVTCRTAAASAPANISRRNAPGRVAQGWRVPKARRQRKPDSNYRSRKRRTHQIDSMATLAFASVRGTEGSNPSPYSGGSANFRSLEVDGPADVAKVFRRRSGRRVPQTRRPQYRSRGWVRDRHGRRVPTRRVGAPCQQRLLVQEMRRHPTRHIQYADLTVQEFRARARLHIEALNHALAGIPPERMRMHLC